MPARQLQVMVPLEYEQYVVDALEAMPSAHRVASFGGRGSALVICRARDKHTGAILHRLEELGVGVRFGSIDILNLQMTKPRMVLQPSAKRRKHRADDRMTIEEIYEFVDSQTHLTFDYLALTVIAGIIAAVGLLTDSSVLVVASMLVAPLMGPILGMTFGTMQRDGVMMWKGFRNEAIGTALTFAVGCACALCVVYTSEPLESWTTDEMTQRGTKGSLVAGVAVAIPSGVGVALAATSGGISALVGVAISASLLPPIVNSGLALVLGLVEHRRSGKTHHLTICGISMALFIINWLLIYAFALVTFRIKRIRPVRHGAGGDGEGLPGLPPATYGSFRDGAASGPPSSLATDDFISDSAASPPARHRAVQGADEDAGHRPLLAAAS